jgi:hypothetical protein
MTNGRAKGAAAEREASKEWARITGCEARRGQQFSGGKDSPDVVHDAGDIHLEVKRVERGNPYDWMDQAIRDCGGKVPLVLHRRNNRPWLAIVRLDDVPRLAAELGQKAEAVGGGAISDPVPSQGVPPAGGSATGDAGVFLAGRRHGAGGDCATGFIGSQRID